MGILDGIKSALGGSRFRDLFDADPQARQIKAAVARGDMSSTAVLLQQLRAGSWADRHFFCEVVAENGLPQVLEAWCQNEPANPVPFLLRGARGIVIAWDARGHGSASSVTPHGRAMFLAHLEQSRQALFHAAQLDPEDPTPHSYLLTVAKGLQAPVDVARHHFGEAVARDPYHFPAHAAMLSLLTEKWGGSHAAMFDFARRAAAAAPEGNELWGLKVLAHIERWLYPYAFDGDDAAAAAWVSDPGARHEVIHSYAKCFETPCHRATPYTLQRRSEFAFWFYLSGDRERLQPEMSLLGDVCTEMPWALLGRPDAGFAAARRAAGL